MINEDHDINNSVKIFTNEILKLFKNEDDLLQYLKLWKRIFHFKTIKYRKKLLKIIYEVINDINNLEESYRYYKCEDDINILDFKQFLKNN